MLNITTTTATSPKSTTSKSKGSIMTIDRIDLRKQLIEAAKHTDDLHPGIRILLEEAAEALTTEQLIQYLQDWRGIDTPCPKCQGSGYIDYANTATYHPHSIAGQAITNDVCNKCWGSGDATNHWPSRL